MLRNLLTLTLLTAAITGTAFAKTDEYSAQDHISLAQKAIQQATHHLDKAHQKSNNNVKLPVQPTKKAHKKS